MKNIRVCVRVDFTRGLGKEGIEEISSLVKVLGLLSCEPDFRLFVG